MYYVRLLLCGRVIEAMEWNRMQMLYGRAHTLCRLRAVHVNGVRPFF